MTCLALGLALGHLALSVASGAGNNCYCTTIVCNRVPMDWRERTPVASSLSGLAAYYNPGVMARVAVRRGVVERAEDLEEWLGERGLAGTVALNRAGDLGRRVWLEGPSGVEGPFLVLDCAQRDHFRGRQAHKLIADVDWPTAKRWRMRGPVAVRVWFFDPVGQVGKVHSYRPIYHEE